MKPITKKIQFENIEILAATIAISFKTKPSTIALVLSELIKLSKNATIPNAKQLPHIITEKFGITPEAYRAVISKLYRMKLITRENDTIYLAPMVRTPFDQILISKPSHNEQ